MEQKTLIELADIILLEMNKVGFKEKTITFHARIFKRIIRIANQRKETYYSQKLGEEFINDNLYVKTGEYNHIRYCLHCRCVQFIESYINDGKVNWTPNYKLSKYPLKSSDLTNKLVEFKIHIKKEGLKPNTIDGYQRLVYYFLLYLEDKSYHSLNELKYGDTVTFIALVCKEHYQPTSLGAHLPGLKMFLNMQEYTTCFIKELPEHLPKKREILKVYSDDEYDKIYSFLENSSSSLRNKAISLIALETGLRAVDICNLMLNDIDWINNSISIVQRKTGHPLTLPLSIAVGNGLVDYLLSERPPSDLAYVFLSGKPPFNPLITHSGCRNILKDIISNAGVEQNGRIDGTRITRHSAASRMLRHGTPLTVISQILGHSNSNSSMIYITTHDETMAECTLPLPENGVEHNDR